MRKHYYPYASNMILQEELKTRGLSISFLTPAEYVQISKDIGEEVPLAFAKKDLAKYSNCEIEIKEILIVKLIKHIEEKYRDKTKSEVSKLLGITGARLSKIVHRSYSELSISYLVKLLFKLDKNIEIGSITGKAA